MKMLNITILMLRVRFTITGNRVIHFLRILPLIKKVVPQTAYGNYEAKTLFTILAILSKISKRFILRLLYALFVVCVGLLVGVISANGGFAAFIPRLTGDGININYYAFNISYILFVWFFFSIVGSFAFGPRLVPTYGYALVNSLIHHLRLEPVVYAKSHYLFEVTSDVILYAPYLLVAVLLGRLPGWYFPLLIILFVLWRFIGIGANLLMFKRFRTHFDNLPFSSLQVIIFPVGMVIPVIMGPEGFSKVITNPIFLILSLLFGVICYLYIQKYPLYKELINERLKELTAAFAKMKANKGSVLNVHGSKNWSKGLEQEDLQSDQFSHKTGFAYLNAIFFARHSRFFAKKMTQRLLGILLIGMIGIVVPFGYFIINGYFLFGSYDDSGLELLVRFVPVAVFIVYFVSMGRVVTASVFSNCDIHMLHYPYYRTKETIFSSFQSRISRIAKYNFLITLTMAAVMSGALFTLTGTFDFLRFVLIFVMMLMTGIFFAFNDLFLYYVIQPYNSAGESKSIIYTIINIAIYALAWMTTQSRWPFEPFVAVVVIITVLYVGVGTLLLLKFAPKMFKLR